MRIAIVGAGAIGGWLGAKLATAGHEVSVLARGATLGALLIHGFRLIEDGHETSAAVVASDDPAELGPQDLVIVAVKGPAMRTVASAVAALLGPDTTVLPAMNGVPWWFFSGARGPLAGTVLESVDPGGTIARLIPADRIVGCIVHAACATCEPGRVVHRMGRELIVGEPSGEATPRLVSVASVLGDAGFEVTPSDRIQYGIWYKLWGNMTMNPVSALTGATADRILDDPLVCGFILQVMAEAAEVGARIGAPITESSEDRCGVTRKLGAFRTSMLQDAEAGRPMEIDALLSAPRARSRKWSA